ncbi:MAG: hypothetical protein HYX24_01345 [Candidatus Aenigmarchaeota archaeon]|nr:hypothetical protein [Candidatus Aenigmarchaeota archaeon]
MNQQYRGEMDVPEFEEGKKAGNKLILMVAGLVIIIAAAAVILLFPQNEDNGTETPALSPTPTPKPVCGNGVCEYFEKPDDCCIDCFCYGATEVCNKQKNRCEIKISKLSSEEAKRLIENYYQEAYKKGGTDFELTNVTDIENYNFENKVGKRALVLGIHHPAEGEPFEDYETALVSDDGKVTAIEHA